MRVSQDDDEMLNQNKIGTLQSHADTTLEN